MNIHPDRCMYLKCGYSGCLNACVWVDIVGEACVWEYAWECLCECVERVCMCGVCVCVCVFMSVYRVRV